MTKSTLLKSAWPWSLAVFVLAFVIYIPTVLPGPLGGDAGELQYAGPLFTLTHMTGYPVYVVLSWLWGMLVPVGTMAYRMNLLSAFSAALSGATTTCFIHRLTRQGFIAAICGLVLSLGGTMWLEATGAEKYTFVAFTAAGVIGMTLIWLEQRDESNGDKLLYAMSFTYGLSLLHHKSTWVFGPILAALVVILLRADLWRKLRRSLIALALVFGPSLIVYPALLPYLRDRAEERSVILWRPHGLADWLTWGFDSESVSHAFVGEDFLARQLHYARTLAADYTIIPVLLAVVGVVALARRKRWASVGFLVVSFFAQAILSANYRLWAFPDKFFLSSYVILFIAAGYGIAALWDAISERLPEQYSKWGAGALMLLALALPVYQVAINYPVRMLAKTYGDHLDPFRQELRTDDAGRRLANGLADLPPDTVLVGDWEQATVFWYMQQVEGLRPDVTLVYPIQFLGDYAGDPRPLALARNLPVGDEWHPTNAGPLILLQREPSFDLPAGMITLGVDLYTPDGQPQIQLAGQTGAQPAYLAGSHNPLLLVWQALADLEIDYSISLHILTESWEQVWARDINAPVVGMSPTSNWVAGEVVQDYHELSITPDLPPGRYLWTVVVYRQRADGGFETLVDENGNVEIPGGTFEVIAP